MAENLVTLIEAPLAFKTRFPFFTLLIWIPICILIFGTSIVLFVSREWGNGAFAFVVSVVPLIFAYKSMRGHWTAGRGIWIGTIFMVWMAACIGAGIEDRQYMDRFGPVENEFARYAPGLKVSAQKPKPKLFILLARKRAWRDDPPHAPIISTYMDDKKLFDGLPDGIRALNASEVETVAILDWGWQGPKPDMPGVAQRKALIGKCDIELVDRRTRNVIAATTLLSQEVPPTGNTVEEWHGPQPAYKEVAEYLRGAFANSVDAEAPEK